MRNRQKRPFFAKNDVFLTKKWAKMRLFCCGSASGNKTHIVDLMSVIRNLIGKNALSQPPWGVGIAISRQTAPTTRVNPLSGPIRFQGSRQANNDLQSARMVPLVEDSQIRRKEAARAKGYLAGYGQLFRNCSIIQTKFQSRSLRVSHVPTYWILIKSPSDDADTGERGS
jgi:hypothetical protein